jgi:hypothetical protein
VGKIPEEKIPRRPLIFKALPRIIGWCLSTLPLEPFFKDNSSLRRLEATGVELF